MVTNVFVVTVYSAGNATTAECRNNSSVLDFSKAPKVKNTANGMLKLVNWAREYCSLQKLSIDKKLNKASRRHSRDMANRNYFDHNALAPAPNGVSPWDRAANAGTSADAENIAAGNKNVRKTFIQWWKSNGHRTNILGSHTKMGFGYSYSASSQYRHYNTQMFK